MHFIVRALSAAAVVAMLGGCGEKTPQKVRLGDASSERRAEFAKVVARSCARFDGLDGADVKFEVSTNGSSLALAVSCAEADRRRLPESLSVAVTNLSLEYPGLGFMMDDDGTWKVLMPDDIMIPVSGVFGLSGE